MSLQTSSRPRKATVRKPECLIHAMELYKGRWITVYYPQYRCMETYKITRGLARRRYDGVIRWTIIIKDRFNTRKLVKVTNLIEDPHGDGNSAADLAARSERELDTMPIVVDAKLRPQLEAYVFFLED